MKLTFLAGLASLFILGLNGCSSEETTTSTTTTKAAVPGENVEGGAGAIAPTGGPGSAGASVHF